MARVDYWNHNVHYQRFILAAVPAQCGRALDVGCGDGLLAVRLADRCAEVTGIDSDAPIIAQADHDGGLLRPGGRLAVIGIAANGSAGDTVAEAASLVVIRYYQAVHHEGDPGAPVQAPDMTWAQVRATVRATVRGLLPGVRYRRRLLWRYSLLWTKPGSS